MNDLLNVSNLKNRDAGGGREKIVGKPGQQLLTIDNQDGFWQRLCVTTLNPRGVVGVQAYIFFNGCPVQRSSTQQFYVNAQYVLDDVVDVHVGMTFSGRVFRLGVAFPAGSSIPIEVGHVSEERNFLLEERTCSRCN